MVIKVYTSGISGNKEVKKRQQRILMILESKNIKYETIDITEPGKEEEKTFMQEHAVAKDGKHPLPPQIFNEDDYCGDYVGFDLANENDELEVFLKMPIPATVPVINGKELSTNEDSNDQEVPERNEEIISKMIPPDTTENGVEKENVHGFCYTPSLAKRLEKAIKATLRKPKPPPLPVHGFVYTPSLAQRLAKAILKSHKRAAVKSPSPEPCEVDEDEMEDDAEELDSSVKDEMEADAKSEDEGMEEDGAEGEE